MQIRDFQSQVVPRYNWGLDSFDAVQYLHIRAETSSSWESRTRSGRPVAGASVCRSTVFLRPDFRQHLDRSSVRSLQRRIQRSRKNCIPSAKKACVVVI
jgi:hypothetical protein